jgi:hypothetical protein
MYSNNIKRKYYGAYINDLLKSISNYEESWTAKKRNISFEFCVDCSEIIRYCFPYENVPQEDTFTSQYSDFFRDRISLLYMFNSVESFYILPPHVFELKYFIDHVKSTINQNSLTILLSNAKHFINQKDSIKKLISNEKSILEGHITEEIRKTILDSSEDFFLPINALESLFYIQQVDMLYELFANNKLKLFDDDYHDLICDNEYIIAKCRPFYELYCNLRKGKDSSNYNDALASAILLEYNGYLKKQNKLGILISKSSVIFNEFDGMQKISSNVLKYSLIWNLEYFLIASFIGSLYFEEEKINSYSFLKKELNILYKSYEMIDKYKGFGRVLSEKAFIQRVENLDRLFIHLNNLILYKDKLSQREQPRIISKEGINKQNEIQKYYNLLLSINFDDDFQSQLAARIERATDKLKSLTTTLEESLDENHSFKDGVIKISTAGEFVTLSGVRGEMPTLIWLRNKTVIKTAKEIFSNVGHEISFNSIKQLILSKIRSGEAKEYQLLLAYVEACLENWDNAITIIDNIGDEDIRKELLLECYYLKTFLCRKMENTNVGIQIANKGLSINDKDPRILREKAVLLWQVRKQTHQSKQFKISRKEISLSNITRIIIDAMQNITPLYPALSALRLKLRCMNSLAYLYAEYNSYKYILKAEKIIKEMYTLAEHDEEKFPSRFFDTIGYVYYKKSLLGVKQINKATRLKYLERSMKYYNKALLFKDLIRNENTIVISNYLHSLNLFIKLV